MVLFVVPHPTGIAGSTAIAEYLKKHYQHIGGFLYKNSFGEISEVRREGHTKASRQIGRLLRSLKRYTTIGNLPYSLKKYAVSFQWYQRKQQKQTFLELEKRYRKVQGLLEKYHVRLIAFYGTRGISNVPVIKAGIEKSIPMVVLPLAEHATVETLLPPRRVNPLYWVELFPELAQEFRNFMVYDPQTNRHVFFYPAFAIQALKEFGLIPPKPWIQGSGFSQIKVMVGGQEEHNRLLKEGLETDNLVITGRPEHDKLFHLFQQKSELKSSIYQRYGFKMDSPLIVVALPQLWEHGVLDWGAHKEHIQELMQVLRSLEVNILISLHPKMDAKNYTFIEDSYQAVIAQERLFDILPAADVFVASYSSTVQWAMLCEIPTIVEDFVGLRYSVFDRYPGVKIVRNSQEFAQALRKVLQDAEHRRKLIADMRRFKSQIAPFDGKALHRIAESIVVEVERNRRRNENAQTL